MSKRNSFKIIIGRDVPVDFPDFNVEGIAARVDTGAYRSAIHARNIREVDGVLHFELLGGHPVFGIASQKCTTKKYDNVRVENSFGHAEERFQVTLKIKVGTKVFKAPFSLADRSAKKYPILLGRTMLNDRFLVDTAMSNIDRKKLERRGISMPLDEEQEYS